MRGRIVLLADAFLMWGGFFMVIPLISVHYVDGLGWAGASIGLVLAVRQLLQQGITPLSGILADRLGAKGLIVGGMALRSVGFVVMARADTLPLLMASALLAALGGGAFESPKVAAMAALTDEGNRSRYYSLSGVVGAVGVTVGTQVGALLIRVDFALVALASAGCFAVASLLTLALLPPVRVASGERGLLEGAGQAVRDRPFVLYTALLMGYWFLWVQFTISLPLAATALGGSSSAVSWLYGIQSGMTIVLGYPLPRLAERRLRPISVLVLGVVLMSVGLGAVAWADGLAGLLGCVVVLSAGVLLAFPMQQTVTAQLADPASLGSYVGLNMLALAVGGALGNLGGGLLYDAGRRLGMPGLPWLTFAVVGLLTAGGLALLASRQEVAGEARRAEVVVG